MMRLKNYPILAAILLATPLANLAAVESVTREMETAANAFLDSLTIELKARATFPMEVEGERTNWHFVPIVGERKGVDLKDLDEAQEAKLNELLAAGLSATGREKVKLIQELESVLFMLENSDHRDPELYYISIFGKPSSKDAWGWRFEGHHLSLNFTIVDGRLLSYTPNFWAANPAKVPSGAKKGLRALKEEEDAARALLKSLSPAQQTKAIVADKAPKDIYTGDDPQVYPFSNYGVKASEFSPKQVAGLERLINAYLQNMTKAVAADRWEKIKDEGIGNISFTWAGGKEVGDAHYYRVQGPSFLIEYDNIQNGANHIHAVWRDFSGDFGRNILWEHHKHAH